MASASFFIKLQSRFCSEVLNKWLCRLRRAAGELISPRHFRCLSGSVQQCSDTKIKSSSCRSISTLTFPSDLLKLSCKQIWSYAFDCVLLKQGSDVISFPLQPDIPSYRETLLHSTELSPSFLPNPMFKQICMSRSFSSSLLQFSLLCLLFFPL